MITTAVAGRAWHFSHALGRPTNEHIGDFARREFVWPAGIAMVEDGRLLVTDEFRHHVAIFPSDIVYPFPEFNPDGERIGDWPCTAPRRANSTAPAE